MTGAALGVAACIAAVEAASVALAIITFGVSLAGGIAGAAVCATAGGAIGYVASGTGNTKQPPPKNHSPPTVKNFGTPATPAKKYGQYVYTFSTSGAELTNPKMGQVGLWSC